VQLNRPANAGVRKQQQQQQRPGPKGAAQQRPAGGSGPLAARAGPANKGKKGVNSFGVKLPL
jgi:hypothetical protein